MADRKYPRHDFWGAGETDCPADLKAPNGELRDMRCKVCGDGWRESHDVCMVALRGTPSLPEQDPAVPNTEQGLYRKFEVYRTDRTDAGPGCKHYGCDYFVIDVTHDQHARAALAAYADACEAAHPELAADMRKRYALGVEGLKQ